MTNQALEKLIDDLNDGDAQGLIFINHLQENVYLGRVWTDLPKGSSNNIPYYTVYFIKNDEKFIGAVLDMGSQDLHCFLKTEYRGKGIICNTLKDIILPHLFSEDRVEQALTFETKEAAKSAELAGFELINNKTAYIHKTDIKSFSGKISFESANKISAERKSRVFNRIRIAKEYLHLVKADLLSCYSEEELDDITYVIDDIGELNGIIDDLWFNSQEKLRNKKSK